MQSLFFTCLTPSSPQWGAADAEIKVPPGENTELKRSPFQAWSRSVYSHTCNAYCQGFLPCLFLPFWSIHLHFFRSLSRFFSVLAAPHWGAADADIKAPSGENTELKCSPFKALNRSVYSHTCNAYCQGFLPCLSLPFWSIHLHFFQKPLPNFPVLAVANTWFLCRPAE